MNMGAWSFVQPRMHTILKAEGKSLDTLRYAGRKPAASTATGYSKVHAEEQVGLIKLALAG